MAYSKKNKGKKGHQSKKPTGKGPKALHQDHGKTYAAMIGEAMEKKRKMP